MKPFKSARQKAEEAGWSLCDEGYWRRPAIDTDIITLHPNPETNWEEEYATAPSPTAALRWDREMVKFGKEEREAGHVGMEWPDEAA